MIHRRHAWKKKLTQSAAGRQSGELMKGAEQAIKSNELVAPIEDDQGD